jgi:signal transduction histidine kinase
MLVVTAPLLALEQGRAALDGLPQGLLLTDDGDRVVYANPRLAALARCEPAAAVGRPVAELLAPPAGTAWPRPAPAGGDGGGVIGGTEVAEIELGRPDGSRFWALVHAAPRPGGGWVRLVADIGERKHAESDQARLQAALTHAAREWQLTFDAVETPLLVAGRDRRVTRLNRAAQRLAGRDFPDLVGREVTDLGGGEPWRTAAALIAHAVGRRGSRSVSTHDAATGRSWELAASLYTGPESGGDRVIVVMRDVSGLVRLQESLRRSEVMSALGTLVAGVAHEVRNPLFGLSAVLDAFESRFGDQEAHRSYLALVKAQVQRLNVLMQQLLDYGKPLALELTPGRLEEAAAEAVAGCAALAGGRGVEVTVDAAPGLPAVPMDRAGIVQAFQNLIDNAVAHSPRRGRVRVVLAAGAGGGAPGRLGGWVTGRVEDSGPGFRPEDLARVFDPFFSRRRGGTGLGLSIVQRVVEQHGGRITAANRPGGGAVMELLLPAAPPAEVAAAAATAETS